MSLPDSGAQFALDMQGLSRLKHTAARDPANGARAAAQQFEALFVQTMLKSMRDAIPTTGLLDSRQTQFYQSLLDQQWSQEVAERGIGLADRLVEQLEARGLVPPDRAPSDGELAELIAGIPRGAPRVLQDALIPEGDMAEGRGVDEAAAVRAVAPVPASFLDELETARGGFLERVVAVPQGTVSEPAPSEAPAAPVSGSTGQAARDDATPPEHVRVFLDRLTAPAQAASRETGVPAELILAQAALETGWGRHEIATADGRNSHNLFGIKAGAGWAGPTTEITTHEVIAGRRTRVTDRFRVYDSFAAAFTDYARLIGDNPRYARVTTAPDAAQAARELQAGGYATDPAYADKLIAVMDRLGPLERARDSLVFLRY